MNHFVTRDLQQALLGVSLLKEAKKGRAGFINAAALPVHENLPANLPARATAALSVVSCDDWYKPLLQQLLAHVFILEEDSLLEEHVQTYPDLIFVTPSGHIVHRPYDVRGGSAGAFDGKRLGRARNLEKLQEDILHLQENATEAKEQFDHIQQNNRQLRQDIDKHRKEQQTYQQQVNILQQEKAAAQSRFEQLTEAIAAAHDKREVLQEQLYELQEKIDTLTPQAAEAEELLTAGEEQTQDVEEQQQQQNSRLAELSAAYNEQNQQYFSLQNQRNALQQEITFRQSALQETDNRIKQNEQHLAETRQI